jgi:plasmid stabilization system protein ParE
VERILGRVAGLADLPWTAPPWRAAADPSLRRMVVDDYVVIYRVVVSEPAVYVLAVRHGRLRPPDPGDLP